MTCDGCNRRFGIEHISSHLAKSQCAYVLRLKSGIKCGQCDKYFSTEGNLDRHVRAIHDGDVKFPCQLCGSDFTQVNLLAFKIA